MKTIRLAVLTGAAAAGLVACAGRLPPQELVNARAAYNSAAASNAARFTPDDLYTAQRKLAEAERAFEEAPRSEETRSKAYVAERAALVARARADVKDAQLQVSQAAAARVEMLENQRDVAQMSLDDTRGELDRLRDSSSRALEERRRALEERQRQLEAAEQARTEAERQTAAAIESLRSIAELREEARGTVITLPGAVLFATGKSTLLPQARQKLDRVATALEGQDRMMTIEGHTDSVGTDENNQRLSEERANAVRDYLVSKGIPENKLRAVGYGENQPLAPNDSAENRATNRRVEIVLAAPESGVGSTSPQPAPAPAPESTPSGAPPAPAQPPTRDSEQSPY